MKSLYDLEQETKRKQKSLDDKFISWCDGKVRDDNRRFVTNPYKYDLYGVIENRWFSVDEYNEAVRAL